MYDIESHDSKQLDIAYERILEYYNDTPEVKELIDRSLTEEDIIDDKYSLINEIREITSELMGYGDFLFRVADSVEIYYSSEDIYCDIIEIEE